MLHSLRNRRVLLGVAAMAAFLGITEAHAFRMIQNTGVGRFSAGARVTCNDAGGFTHWANANISWRHNTANQGAGKATALQNAMASWTGVSGASHVLSYAGTTTAGFVTDGINTALWANGNGCTGSCLALTALVLTSGQVITETDVTFNNAVTWSTSGSDYDTEAIAAHELGHTLGIHHTEINKPQNRPTMYAYYFGTAGRTLENDDRSALQCAQNRYPPSGPGFAAEQPLAMKEGSARLSFRQGDSGARLRFSLDRDSDVQLRVYDVAGRMITTLAEGRRAAGDHELAWDGAFAGGRVRQGVYFARLVAGDHVARTTVVLSY